jgi:hypothetical protein
LKGTDYMTRCIFTTWLFLAIPTAAIGSSKTDANKVTTIPVPGRGQPVVARTDSNGTIHLLYDSADGPHYVMSTDNGKTFSAAMPVVDKASRKRGLEFYGADMALGKAGCIHVAMITNAWKLKLPNEEWGFLYARLEPCASAYSPVRNLNKKPSEGFSLAADDKGNVTACWLCDKLYANISHDGGKTFAAAVEINPAYDPCNCCTTSAEYGADGKLAVLYREETNNERDMYLVLWDQQRQQTSRTRVSSTLWKIDTCPMSAYSISRKQDGFVAVWPTRDQVYFSHLDGKGKQLSPGEIKTPGRSGMHTAMRALSAPDGSTLVVWKKDDRMGWQLYDAKGQPSGSPGSAQSPGNGVAAVMAKAGQFILFR